MQARRELLTPEGVDSHPRWMMRDYVSSQPPNAFQERRRWCRLPPSRFERIARGDQLVPGLKRTSRLSAQG